MTVPPGLPPNNNCTLVNLETSSKYIKKMLTLMAIQDKVLSSYSCGLWIDRWPTTTVQDPASTFDSPGAYYPLLSLIDTQETVGRADGRVVGSMGTQLVDKRRLCE